MSEILTFADVVVIAALVILLGIVAAPPSLGAENDRHAAEEMQDRLRAAERLLFGDGLHDASSMTRELV
ncbi:MAG: hypothetical protein ACRDQE_08905 [Gaiellales bacterium]